MSHQKSDEKPNDSLQLKALQEQLTRNGFQYQELNQAYFDCIEKNKELAAQNLDLTNRLNLIMESKSWKIFRLAVNKMLTLKKIFKKLMRV